MRLGWQRTALIGLSYARLFGSRGARLVINDLSRDNADKAVKQLTDSGGASCHEDGMR